MENRRQPMKTHPCLGKMPKGRGFLLCKEEKRDDGEGERAGRAVPRAKPAAVPASRRDCLPAPPVAGVAGCQVGERAGRVVPRAKPDAVPAGRRDCLPASPGARTANREQKRHADSEKANSYCLWRAGGEKENLRFAGNRRQDRRKGTLVLKRPTLLAFGEPEGKKENLRLAGNRRQDRRKRHDDAEKTNSYCLWRAESKRKSLRLAENRRKCRRKIIRWRIGFGTVGRRNRPFPAAAGDCPAR